MCGITITSCSKRINLSTRIKPLNIAKRIKNLIKFNKFIEINKLLELSILYKSDSNFLNYFKFSEERREVKLCKDLLVHYLNKNNKNILKQNWENVEKIHDIIWFLGEELNKRYLFVKKFINKNNYNNQSIIFFKTLNSVINSINYLEIRGRDSLGLMLNISIKKNRKNILIIKKKFSNKNYYIREKKDCIVLNVTYKTCNIFGSLEDNSKEILDKMKKDELILKLLKTGDFEYINIVTHTRWASIGQVNLQNTHPLVNVEEVSKKLPTVFSVMNGDINNYEKIISNVKKIKGVKYNKTNKSDTLALSHLFNNKCDFKNLNKIKKKIMKTEGSYTGAVLSDDDISKILFIKQGNLGLYYGENKDRKFFSSDIYGLVEECIKFYEFKKNSYFLFDSKNNNEKLKVFDLFSNNKKIINSKMLENISISLRDISKKSFSYYLEKEIYETSEIINKTFFNYIESKNLRSTKNSNLFINKDLPKLNSIINKIKKGKINRIIVTGMGTCYTAAEVIALYMKNKILKYLPEVNISASLASEASAFDMPKDLSNVLIIAIAQSGTTKDTNVYLDMAKKRGALTICFLNKRKGDISYIVDKTLYLANGRSIEIAVPSTKTYICHIILGYIFTLYLLTKTTYSLKKIKNELIQILKIPKLISSVLDKNNKKSINLNKLFAKFSKNQDWYCLFDSSSKHYASMEIRIKLSECCYHSLPYMNVNDFIQNKVKNSILIYNFGVKFIDLNLIIKKLIKDNNYIVLIGAEDELRKIKKNRMIFKMPNPQISSNFSIIPSVINGQILSLRVAKHLNNRGDFFKRLSTDLKENRNYKYLKKFIGLNIKQTFLINYPFKKILNLKSRIKRIILKKQKNIYQELKILDYLDKYSRRPIDTIKHQAKTITVGTERIADKKSEKNNEIKFTKKKNLKKPTKFNFINFSFINANFIKKIYLISNNVDNCYIDFMKRYLNYFHQNIKNFPETFIKKHDSNINDRINNYLLIKIANKENNNEFNKINLDIYYSNKKSHSVTVNKIKNTILKNEKNEFIVNFLKILEICNSIIFNLSSKEKRSTFYFHLQKLIFQIENSFKFYKKNRLSFKILFLKKRLLSSNNIKFIGGNTNFDMAKLLAKLLSKSANRACAFDTLENHKHIDISAEPILVTIISNISNSTYMNDVYSEIDKYISHNNIPYIITNEVKKNFSKKLKKNQIIKIPYTEKEVSIIFYLKLFEGLYK